MTKYEYFQLEQTLAIPSDVLNSLGNQGWELIGVYEAQSAEKAPVRNVFVFKRLIDECPY